MYTHQIPGFPFAAPHGDPDIVRPGFDRYGPTAVALPFLDQKMHGAVEYWNSIKECVRMLDTPDKDFYHSLTTVIGILFNEQNRAFMLKNLAYNGPGKVRAFLPNMQKIVPSIRLEDVQVAKDDFGDMVGGIRPQVINRHTKTMMMGEVTIAGPNARFMVTPSPGATACLETGRKNAPEITQTLGYCFDMERWIAAHTPSR